MVWELKVLVQCYRILKGIDLLIIAGSQRLIDYVGGPRGALLRFVQVGATRRGGQGKGCFRQRRCGSDSVVAWQMFRQKQPSAR